MKYLSAMVLISASLCACNGGRDNASRAGETGPDAPPSTDTAAQLPGPTADVLGCDPLDPSYCLFPFPNNHFTTTATPGSPQSVAAGGTGLKLNLNPLQMPRNVLGKPVDPTEWNRNDGFSPGAMLMTYIPDLAHQADGSIPGAVSLARLNDYLAPQAPILVIDTATSERHPIWAEVDLNAGFFQPSDEFGEPLAYPDGRAPKAALIIRPARNFAEGHRYLVILRKLKDTAGQTIPASASFAACRDGQTPPPTLIDRCASLEERVFAALPADVSRDELLLAWDFTVASQASLSGRLLHIRDDAFAALGETMDRLPGEAGYDPGRAPVFSVDAVIEAPREGIARRIEGHLTIPSYVVPVDPSPLEAMRNSLAQVFSQFPDALAPAHQACRANAPLGEMCLIFDPEEALAFGSAVSAPPNRFFYDPRDSLDAPSPWGDGLPDRLSSTASMTRPFTCNLPSQASAQRPARPSLYGHGLLGTRGEVNSSHVTSMGGLHNMLFCAVDWFGFSTGDLANILSILVDVSNLPVLADAAQQGVLNMLFLARALNHPDGFASHPAFQDEAGRSLIDPREVFFDGNSQGGIMGGVVVATSRDVNRGVLGVPGMNYSTLLRRSVDFDLYSVPLYTAYPDDLDRTFLLGFMEMLWERAENNAYAQHMNTAGTLNTPLPGTPDNQLLLHVGFSDHQVTMWSADVMARTLRAPVDRAGLDRNPLEANAEGADRHPDEHEYAFLEDLHATGGAQYVAGGYAGSALVIWDEPWDAVEPETRCANDHTEAAPLGNVPPRGTGDDPHECPRREPGARCQKAHFLYPGGQVLDVRDIHLDADCPALP